MMIKTSVIKSADITKVEFPETEEQTKKKPSQEFVAAQDNAK